MHRVPGPSYNVNNKRNNKYKYHELALISALVKNLLSSTVDLDSNSSL